MKIHFIGIGGIGTSALAHYFLAKGEEISGSDLASNEITEELIRRKVKIAIGPHKKENVPQNADLVIFTPAVNDKNPEFMAAKFFGIKLQSYPEALGELTKNHFTIAISGTHGKSTTTSMTGLLLTAAGLDPTVIVGTKLKEFGNLNFRLGKSKYLVIEADEWNGSFLNYWPQIIVLTNVEKEHLDYFKNLENILKTYKKYISHLNEDGVLIINNDDPNIFKIVNSKFQISNFKFKIQKYSLKQPDAEKIKKILQIPGAHNVANALAALAVARNLGIADEVSFKSLAQYRGAWRRFEEKELEIVNCKLKIISDYGHHPTEISATLAAAREKYPNKKITCVFQPHQYQRTFYLFNDFVKVFKNAPVNRVILTDIYDVAGREESEIKEKVSSEILAKKINKKNVLYLPKKEISKYLSANLSPSEIVIFMGAGDIYELEKKITQKNPH